MCFSFIKLLIDILKHITIVVLQDMQSVIRTEAEQSKDTDIKQEHDVTLDIVPRIKVIKEVKDSVLLCIFMYLLVAQLLLNLCK